MILGLHPGLSTIMLMANLAITKICKNAWKMTETLANGYSSESTRGELSNKYQHGRDSMVLKNICLLALWMKVVLEGSRVYLEIVVWIYHTIGDNFEIKNAFRKHLKRISWQRFDKHFSFKLFPTLLFPCKI